MLLDFANDTIKCWLGKELDGCQLIAYSFYILKLRSQAQRESGGKTERASHCGSSALLHTDRYFVSAATLVIDCGAPATTRLGGSAPRRPHHCCKWSQQTRSVMVLIELFSMLCTLAAKLAQFWPIVSPRRYVLILSHFHPTPEFGQCKARWASSGDEYKSQARQRYSIGFSIRERHLPFSAVFQMSKSLMDVNAKADKALAAFL